MDLVALPVVRDLLVCAKHLFLLPWWLAARSTRHGAGSTPPHALAVAAVAEHLAWRALPCQKVLSSPDRRGPERGTHATAGLHGGFGGHSSLGRC